MKTADEFEKAKNAALRLLKFRARSEKEICDRLKQKKFTDETIAKTVDYLKGLRLLDDREFAKDWVAHGISKSVGPRRIVWELHQKGVNRKILREELKAGKDNYNEREVVSRLAAERFAKYKNIDTEKAKQRTYNYLIYRGFNPEIVEETLEKL